MSDIVRIDIGSPAQLEFRGPDTVRFLNGQLTQDVRRVVGTNTSLPSCVTDAKGRLQFRIWISEAGDKAIRIDGPADSAEALEARITRYLIADDLEVTDLSGKFSLVHFTGPVTDAPTGVVIRESARFGIPGIDWWIPAGLALTFPNEVPLLEGDALEAFRISMGIPAWGSELVEGLLPPEAGLEATDISYQKGCYIGQEVISRIKSAGKVNKQLTKLVFDAAVSSDGASLVDANGKAAGELTSVSPVNDGEFRHALAYVKRGVDDIYLVSADGDRHPVSRA